MRTDYSKKKNAELEELLKSRSLPHTGKKADLVARLQQYDVEHISKEKPVATTNTGGEDEIDWDDDAPVAPTEGSNPAATAAIAAGGHGRVANPAAVPNQVVDTDPSKTNDLTVDPPAPVRAAVTGTSQESTDGTTKVDETPAAPTPTDFSLGLSSTSLDDEIAKRQHRAAKFGIKEDNDDALRALERARKFGTGTAGDKIAVKGLDEALPERVKKERGVKRGREETQDKEPRNEAKRRESGKRNSRRRLRSTSRVKANGGRQARSGSRPKKSGKAVNEPSEKDRLAAEVRKKRFAESKGE